MTAWDTPVLLVVMDGFGLSDRSDGNAITAADTPRLDELMDRHDWTPVPADGAHVGLLPGGLGGSEVGHMQLGAGRIILQMPTIISEAIEDRTFFSKPALVDMVEHVQDSDGTLHVMGLCSDKGIHSHIDHLYAVLDLAHNHSIPVQIHMILDGRDTAPKAAKEYIHDLQDYINDKDATIATVSGRFYAMDRDNRWNRTQKAYHAIVSGDGQTAETPIEAVDQAYERGETDEFVTPTVIQGTGMEDGDAVFLFNFRADRCRQMTAALTKDDFDAFPTEEIDNLYIATMTRYRNNFDNPIVFSKDNVKDTLGEVIADNDMKQYRIAESEKLAHVTYFFSGRREEPFPNEERQIFPSPKVDVYDKTPEMRAEAITDKALAVMEQGEHEFVLVNLSNCDMVGHTGNFEAAVEAVEFVDRCVGRLYDATQDNDYLLLVTADHGNADEMKDDEGGKLTAHSYNKVPFIVAANLDVTFTDEPELAKTAPAILALNQHDQPAVWDEPLFTID